MIYPSNSTNAKIKLKKFLKSLNINKLVYLKVKSPSNRMPVRIPDVSYVEGRNAGQNA